MQRAADRTELHIAFRALPGKSLDVQAILQDNQPYYEAPGGISIELLQATDDQDLFLEVVRYVDQPTYEADQVRVASDPEFLKRLERWHSVLAGAPEIRVYRVIDLSK
ncbi:MAG TPA: antibiotic biosynthesis monooxygenase [Polyangiaceae bacterium]|nr:antibiotic biosynthesis monooxygenase [Polyangiaceae bacterium]